MHADRSNAIDFWPGYVDALINVVLNLLFVVSIFCGGLLATGLQMASPAPTGPHRSVAPTRTPGPTSMPMSTEVAPVSDTPDPRAAPATSMPDRSALALPAPRERTMRGPMAPRAADVAASGPENALPVLPLLTLHVRSPTSKSTDAPPVVIQEFAPADGGWHVDIRYPGGALDLDPAAIATLTRLMNPEHHGRTLQIVATTDLEQAAARQATYRRLIAVRDALVAAGQPRAAIEIRLLTGGQWPERRGGTVRVQEMSAASEVPDTPAP